MRPELIAIDMDGTLLTKDRLPHPESALAISRAVEAGIQVVLASGRIRTSMIPFAEKLGIPSPMISCNGAHVVGPKDQEIVAHSLDKSVFDLVVEYGLKENLHINAYTRNELFFFDHTRWGDEYARRLRTVVPRVVEPEKAREQDILKVLIIDEPQRISEHVRELGTLLTFSRVIITESEPEYLEFLAPEATKGQALQALASSLDIPQSRTAAIGDYFNDLDMVRWAGIGGAMGNATETVRLAADLVVPTNEEGGVATFIDALLAMD